MSIGAPRTTSFPPEEMIELGKEMVEWVKAHPNILHLSEWYTIEKMFIYEEWKCFIKCKEFFPYYEVALKLVGRKYLDKTSDVREGVSQRWQRVYFKDLREQEDEDLKFKSDLAKEVEGSKQANYVINVSPELASGLNLPATSLSNTSPKST